MDEQQCLDIIQEDRRRLQNPYAHLNGEGEFEAIIPDTALTILPSRLFEEIPCGIALTEIQIERIARNLLRKLWLYRSGYFPEQVNLLPLNARNPVIALTNAGFQVTFKKSLGKHRYHDGYLETAGIINRNDMTVQISENFPPETRMFTIAHELGHVLLHQAITQHRDRPLDRASNNSNRSLLEREADKFATHFLMPKKLVRTEFVKRFGTERFVLDDTSTFALNVSDFDKIRKARSCRLELARLLAKAAQYDQVHFVPLSKLFQVSTEAMAIRIKKELKLV